jgi:hypothetical protein
MGDVTVATAKPCVTGDRKWQVTEVCIGWRGQSGEIVPLKAPRDATPEFLERLAQDPLVGGYHLQLSDARAAGHAREGQAGADSVSSEVTVSRLPAGQCPEHTTPR